MRIVRLRNFPPGSPAVFDWRVPKCGSKQGGQFKDLLSPPFLLHRLRVPLLDGIDVEERGHGAFSWGM